MENVTALLDRLGRPQDDLRCIHVAGTDGKGSVCAIVESILRCAGYRVGVFSSPEITSVNECIRFDSEDIDDRDLEFVMGRVREACGDIPCTSFEVLTAVAMEFFRTVSADFAIIEVGMGGRLDSTNVIVPEVTVINNIGLEHTAFLGGTIHEVASEKAGIMKPGVPCVTMNPDPVFEVLEAHAKDIGCPIHRVLADDISVIGLHPDRTEFGHRDTVYEVGIPGRHQARNAVLAIEAVSELGEDLSDHIHEGLAMAHLPCRMEKLIGEPVVVDVTHTVSGARCLAADMSAIYGDVVLVIGMLSDKDSEGVVRELASMHPRVIVTQPRSPRARSAEEMALIASDYMDIHGCYKDLDTAMSVAMDIRGDDIVLVTGSFRMAEGALEWLTTRSSRYSIHYPRSTWAERTLDVIRRV